MKVEIKVISPEMAQQLLSNNEANRNIKPRQVDRMARDILGDRWQVNGDAIRIATDGTLIDGQHRLSAVVAANRPITTMIVSELPSSVRDTIDSGAKRSMGDRLTMQGYGYASQLAAAATQMASLAYNQSRQMASHSELKQIIDNHTNKAGRYDLQDSAMFVNKAFKGMDSMLTAVHYIGCYLGHAHQADAFIKTWKTGVPSYSGDPAHFTREYLMRSELSTKKLPAHTKRLLVTYAWNKFAKAESITRVYTPKIYEIDGWEPEDLGVSLQ